ncbi:L-rhamnose-binding lectin CSL3-like [Ctenopharyngodon idella]|uniref:L-rhamnose-binding lectin CSL3-like n=1 Tax=Ctenopharyngodon idella TaxID=7959 RepID=UPI00222F1955|nr:L-rhamnose-binding lectin CSL3-like [Ctenopharyngodon idella]XP_051738809.1 L-rhamnose-binding lectin CSL3-like [Ctenopharyngodon idella]XP_051738810.1 L-rhamnose-binding lectin CSL3-like [Ctenopharyngodon idella]XP_051738811.1 L-rhamnose-binding lectin CSL3-like [Ctenopharyngodon idella]
MLVKKINWITLLLLLCQHACFLFANKITTLACEGESAELRCDWGYITVFEANYGRTDRTACCTGRPPNEISNLQCFQETSLSTMSARCDGRKNCSVPATNSVFSDPCVGTYKYLDVSYYCCPLKKTITCKDPKCVIDCENNGIIAVQHASSVRQDRVCPDHSAATPKCYLPQTSSLRSRCNGKKSCHLKASHLSFSDHRHIIYKYLDVTFFCV